MATNDTREMLRTLILSHQGSKQIHIESIISVLLPCITRVHTGERTFVEELLPSAMEDFENLSAAEKEVALECLHYLMDELKHSISRQMN